MSWGVRADGDTCTGSTHTLGTQNTSKELNVLITRKEARRKFYDKSSDSDSSSLSIVLLSSGINFRPGWKKREKQYQKVIAALEKKVKMQEMHIKGLKSSYSQYSAKTQKICRTAAAAKYRDNPLNESLNARSEQSIVMEGEIKSNPEDNNVGDQIMYMSTWYIICICLLFIYVRYLNLHFQLVSRHCHCLLLLPRCDSLS